MRKRYPLYAIRYALSFIAIILLSGCESRYLSEKLYWQANQAAKEIINNRPVDKLSAHDYQKIISGYRRVTQSCPLEPLSAQSQFVIAQAYILQNQFARARNELVSVTQNFSKNPEIASQAQFMIGNLYERQGNWEKAAVEYEKISGLFPLSKIGLKMPLYLASRYQRNKDPEAAGKAYNDAIRYYKKFINEYSGTSFSAVLKDYLALAYMSQGNWNKAVDTWQAIVDEYPQSPIGETILFAIGETYSRQIKDLQKAIDTYEDFVRKNPQSKIIKHAEFQIGRLYFIKNDFSKAIQVFKELIKKYPGEEQLCVDSLLAIAACHEKQGEWEKAIGVYKDVRADYRDTPAALSIPLFIAQHYVKENLLSEAEGAFQEAISGYEKIIRENPNTNKAAEAQDFISLAYLSQQKWPQAISSLQALAAAYPNDPRASKSLFTLAIIYQKQLNKPEKAIEIFTKFIEQYPGHELASLAKSEINSLQDK